jgi:hypothetical protein
MCRGSLKVVPCGPFARTVPCPVCGEKLKPLRKTLDGRRAQLRSHAGPVSTKRPDRGGERP